MTETRTYAITRGTGPAKVYHAPGGGWTPIRPMCRRWLVQKEADDYLAKTGLKDARVVPIKTTSKPSAVSQPVCPKCGECAEAMATGPGMPTRFQCAIGHLWAAGDDSAVTQAASPEAGAR